METDEDEDGESVIESAAVRLRPGVASTYGIDWAGDLPAGSRVVLVARLSKREQDAAGTLMNRVGRLVGEAGRRGRVVEGMYARAVSGQNVGWLEGAVRLAPRTASVLVCESTDRLVRRGAFKQGNGREPTVVEFNRLRHELESVGVYTLLHPDAGSDRVASDRVRLGLQPDYVRGRPRRRPGGYGPRAEPLRPVVLSLYGRGHSYRDIAHRTGVTKSTCARRISEGK
ncbi:hypothetical protein [Gemmata sp.]|uniref:hypothetical protein n=1 Tax=Gemmata sp. TaxID=1914242 RepID=UPI003F721FB6